MSLIGLTLRLLAREPIYSLGATRPAWFDVRLVLATNVDPDKLVRLGRWPADLMARLGDAFIVIPPLCERRDEILPFVRMHLAAERERLRRPPCTISTELREGLLLAKHTFNFWGLARVCEYLAAAPHEELHIDDLPDRFRARELGAVFAKHRKTNTDDVRAALAVEGTKRGAARVLQIDERQLYRILSRDAAAKVVKVVEG